MKSTLVNRVTKKSFIHEVLRVLFLKYMSKIAKESSERRGFPIAVFANDWIGANIFADGIYENELIQDLMLVLESVGVDPMGSSCIDVGANIGNHSLQFSKEFARVVAFEPNPRVYEILRANTNRSKNIECFNVGVSKECGSMRLYEDPQNFGGSSAIYEHDSGMSVDVSVDSLDRLAKDVEKVGLIKIDVEGMEFDVLLGAKGILEKHKPIVCFEQHETEFTGDAIETKSIDFLRSLGFEIFCMKPEIDQGLVFRRIRNLYQVFFGVKKSRLMRRQNPVERASYSMLVAVHSDFL